MNVYNVTLPLLLVMTLCIHLCWYDAMTFLNEVWIEENSDSCSMIRDNKHVMTPEFISVSTMSLLLCFGAGLLSDRWVQCTRSLRLASWIQLFAVVGLLVCINPTYRCNSRDRIAISVLLPLPMCLILPNLLCAIARQSKGQATPRLLTPARLMLLFVLASNAGSCLGILPGLLRHTWHSSSIEYLCLAASIIFFLCGIVLRVKIPCVQFHLMSRTRLLSYCWLLAVQILLAAMTNGGRALYAKEMLGFFFARAQLQMTSWHSDSLPAAFHLAAMATAGLLLFCCNCGYKSRIIVGIFIFIVGQSVMAIVNFLEPKNPQLIFAMLIATTGASGAASAMTTSGMCEFVDKWSEPRSAALIFGLLQAASGLGFLLDSLLTLVLEVAPAHNPVLRPKNHEFRFFVCNISRIVLALLALLYAKTITFNEGRICPVPDDTIFVPEHLYVSGGSERSDGSRVTNYDSIN